MTGRWAESLGVGIFLSYLVPPTILFIPFSRIIAIWFWNNCTIEFGFC